MLNEANSEWKIVENWVSSTLRAVVGPLLFLAYINNLKLSIKSKIYTFANDT